MFTEVRAFITPARQPPNQNYATRMNAMKQVQYSTHCGNRINTGDCCFHVVRPLMFVAFEVCVFGIN